MGKDHDRLPGAVDTVAVEKEEDGGQPAGIKGLAALKLGLDEDQRRVLPLRRGPEDAVEAEGSLFDLDRLPAVGVRRGDGQPGKR